jgi:hypothetical protein
MINTIKSVSVVRYPVLRVVFTDGFSGEYDLSDLIATGPAFARLKDRAFFAKVAVEDHGRSFGWALDEAGREIDFCPDATRIILETNAVEALAEQYRLTHAAVD